jgi:GTP-binding protein
MKVLTKFLLSAADPQQFPHAGPPEIAFLGRSNVGKSSLINSLVGNKIAKTSNTPGRTQTINFFEIRWPGRPKADIVFADLPGYGYARVPRELMKEWPKFIDPYLASRPQLALCLCLVDANVPPQQSDANLVEYLRSIGRAHIVVATKADRVGTKIQASMNALRKALGTDQIVAYSSKIGTGKDTLWKTIREASELHAATQHGAEPDDLEQEDEEA